MRGISPSASFALGTLRDDARASSRPPAVSATIGIARSRAASAAESTSAVSPEYDEATTSVCLLAVGGRPYPRWTTIGPSRGSAAHPAISSAPAADPPIAARTTGCGGPRRRRRRPTRQSRRGPRAWDAAARSPAPREERARRDTAREMRPARRPCGARRSARRGADRRVSSTGQPHGGLEPGFIAGADVQTPHEQERRPLIDPLEPTFRERHRFHRAPPELGRRAPAKPRLDGCPLIDHVHLRETRRP